MKYISLFAGIGGFDVALDRLGHTCVFANDNDEYCKYVYDYRFPHKLNNSDIRDVETKTIPEHELLVAGFPCQSFSIAGKRKGFEDTRGTMFFEIARILKDRTPAYVLLENVKGLLTHESGRTFKTILWSLDELGYDVQWQILNSKHYGIAQSRERIFIIGHFRGKPRYKIFPHGASAANNIKKNRFGIHQQDCVIDISGITPSISAYESHRHGYSHNNRIVVPLPFVALTEARSEEAKKIRAAMLKKGKDFSPRRAKVLVARSDNKVNTLTSSRNFDNLLYGNKTIRRLTPIECERLQGFPDNWTKIGVQLYTNKVGNSYMREIPITDTQRYKMLGNAVTVNVVATILQDFVKI